MSKFLTILVCGFFCGAPFVRAEDSWTKVRELKSGSELRILRHGEVKPLMATLEEAHEESIVVATKTEELSISKSEIDRIDSRPAHSGTRVRKETKTSETAPDFSGPDNQIRANRPNQSSSTSLALGGGKDFETIYRRTASNPVNKPVQ